MKRITTHPGVILKKEFLNPLNLTVEEFSHLINIPSGQVTKIINQETQLSAFTALKIAKLFKTTPQFWMNLQVNHDLSKRHVEIESELSKITPIPTIIEH